MIESRRLSDGAREPSVFVLRSGRRVPYDLADGAGAVEQLEQAIVDAVILGIKDEMTWEDVVDAASRGDSHVFPAGAVGECTMHQNHFLDILHRYSPPRVLSLEHEHYRGTGMALLKTRTTFVDFCFKCGSEESIRWKETIGVRPYRKTCTCIVPAMWFSKVL